MNHIVVISQNYPSQAFPHKGAFVYNLVQELSKKFSITVIAPFNVRHIFSKKGESYGPEACRVLRPNYFSFGNSKVLGIDLYKATVSSQKRAIGKALDNLTELPAAIYCHFVVMGLASHSYVEENNIPLIIASGESSYKRIKSSFSSSQFQSLFKDTNFIVCVSNSNMEHLEQMGFDSQKMKVIPNAVDFSLFRSKNKEECKKRLGIDTHKFVIGFIGHFIQRKGPHRVIEAISELHDPNIMLICVGSGDPLPQNDFTRVIPPIPNGDLPDIINAFDIFVLPTLSEGHCNVIEEVKACCIPIISSKGTTVETQITDGENGMLVNPLAIKEIGDAIQNLKQNSDLREKISKNLLEERDTYSLSKRAEQIGDIISAQL